MTETYHANSIGDASCDDEGAAAALGIAKWLCLAATPTFRNHGCAQHAIGAE
jgi:hypothetical protein